VQWVPGAWLFQFPPHPQLLSHPYLRICAEWDGVASERRKPLSVPQKVFGLLCTLDQLFAAPLSLRYSKHLIRRVKRPGYPYLVADLLGIGEHRRQIGLDLYSGATAQ